jgi:prepilin-type N-terminal cleavage/methylation domain-containing protein
MFFIHSNRRRAVVSPSRGFTLLELLMVILIIGLLVAIVMGYLGESRARGRDALRIGTVKELQKAIELYKENNGHYPALVNPASDARSTQTGATCIDGTTGDANWCALIAAIQPYYPGGIDDPTGTGYYSYYYDADGTDPQMYGLMTILESSSNASLANNDGGQFCETCGGSKMYKGYEVGSEPAYCATNFPTKNWRTTPPLAADEPCGN